MSTIGTILLSATVAVMTALATDWLQARRRRKEAKEDRLEEILARYRDPLAYAAFELQSRLYNIAKMRFLEKNLDDERLEGYAVDSTLWLIGQYLGWTELIRQEVEILDLGDMQKNRDLRALLAVVAQVLANDDDDQPPELRILRAEQRGIGEVMIEAAPNGGRRRARGYASFRRLLNEPDPPWFERLAQDISSMKARPEARGRATSLQRALIDLIDHLDEDRSRFALSEREKLPVDRSASGSAMPPDA